MDRRTVRFGLIGCGLMGREFVSAAARWCALGTMDAAPEVVSICRRNTSASAWFTDNIPTLRQVTDDYRAVLANPDVDAVYIAVPHHLHGEIYRAAIASGRHVLGEKPFGIDAAANSDILAVQPARPGQLVRCSSEFPFYPGPQRIGAMIEADAFGTILEVNSGFLHSSDLDPQKPVNWKRQVDLCGEYGCMGDLGMHVCHMPFRAGWRPLNVRAVLSKIVKERPDGKGGMAECGTWDNAHLFCETLDPRTGNHFPMTMRTCRIAPGNTNTWYFEVMGTKACARFSTVDPNALMLLEYSGGEQSWRRVELGHAVTFPVVTGRIFEVGFPDVFLQMCAGFVHELVHGRPCSRFSGCVTPEETRQSHQLFTAALQSHATQATVPVGQ